MSEKFSLKWNDFNSNASASFRALRSEEYLHDVTLVTDDYHKISAHKLVLSASSDFFRDIFKRSKHQHPYLCLDGISAKDIENILDYVYNGEVNIFQEHLDKFLNLAQRLKLQGLLASAEDFASEEQSVHGGENVHPKEVAMKEEKPVETHSQEVQRTSKINMHISGSSIEQLDEKINEYIEKDSEGRYKCGFCGKSPFKWRIHLKNHIETHMEGLQFPCSHCPSILRSRNSFEKHIRKRCKNIQ